MCWSSKLQKEIALSTCEAEYIALSTAMRKFAPLIQLLKYLKVAWNVITMLPTFACKVFEENQSYIVVAEPKKSPTRTKNIVIKNRHFFNLVEDRVIKIKYINAKKQLADILTKSIERNQFFKLRFMLMEW